MRPDQLIDYLLTEADLADEFVLGQLSDALYDCNRVSEADAIVASDSCWYVATVDDGSYSRPTVVRLSPERVDEIVNGMRDGYANWSWSSAKMRTIVDGWLWGSGWQLWSVGHELRGVSQDRAGNSHTLFRDNLCYWPRAMRIGIGHCWPFYWWRAYGPGRVWSRETMERCDVIAARCSRRCWGIDGAR